MMYYWWALVLATGIETDLGRIEDTFNMADGVSPYEKDLSVIAPTLFTLSLYEDPKLTEVAKGMFVGLFVGDAMTLGVLKRASKISLGLNADDIDMKGLSAANIPAGIWSYRSERGMCMAASLLVLGEVNPCDQIQRYVRCQVNGYLANLFPIPSPINDESEKIRFAFESWRYKITADCLRAQGTPVVISQFQTPQYCFQGRKDNGLLPLYAYLSQEYKTLRLPLEVKFNFVTCLAPLVIFDRRCTAQEAINDAVLLVHETIHPTIIVDTCKVLTLLLWALLQGKPKDEVLKKTFLNGYKAELDLPQDSEIWEMIKNALHLHLIDKKDPPPQLIGIGNENRPDLKLCAALWALAHDGGSFQKGMRMAIMLGGATKDIAMIYGMLAGACYGLSGIPEEWRTTLSKITFLEQVAVLLARRRVENWTQSASSRTAAATTSKAGETTAATPSKAGETTAATPSKTAEPINVAAELEQIGTILTRGDPQGSTLERGGASGLIKTIKDSIDLIVRDRLMGLLTGLGVGDALYAFYLSKSDNGANDISVAAVLKEHAEQRPPPLPWTCVTALALATAASFIDCRCFSRYDQLQRCLLWYKGSYFSLSTSPSEIKNGMKACLDNFDEWRIKATKEYAQANNLDIDAHQYTDTALFLKGIKKYRDLHAYLEKELEKENFACSGPPSENIPLIRVAVAALFTFRDTVDHAIETAVTVCKVTHSDQDTVDSCKYYALLLWATLNGMDAKTILDPAFYETHKRRLNLCTRVEEIAECSYRDAVIKNIVQGTSPLEMTPPHGILGGKTSTAIGALKAALWNFTLDTSQPFGGIEKLFKLGGDGSTVGAVYGALAGASSGRAQINYYVLSGNRLVAHNFIGDIAMILAVTEGLTGATLTQILEETKAGPTVNRAAREMPVETRVEPKRLTFDEEEESMIRSEESRNPLEHTDLSLSEKSKHADTSGGEHADAPPRELEHVDAPPEEIKHVDAPPRELEHVEAPLEESEHMSTPPEEIKHVDTPPEEIKHADAPPRELEHADAPPRELEHAETPPGHTTPSEKTTTPPGNPSVRADTPSSSSHQSEETLTPSLSEESEKEEKDPPGSSPGSPPGPPPRYKPASRPGTYKFPLVIFAGLCMALLLLFIYALVKR